MNKTVSVLSAPFDLGAGRRGAKLGPETMLHLGLERQLKALNLTVVNEGEVAADINSVPQLSSPALKHLAEIAAFNNALAQRVADIAGKGHFPLVLGGDHSIAIGTVSGLTRHYKKLGVIWIDAHSDLNTEDSTPSGNVHGMSLAVNLGQGHELLTRIRGNDPTIDPTKVVIIGARQLDPGEKETIRSRGITCYTMHEVDRMGMARIMEEAIRVVTSGTDGVHLSFDIDSVDPQEAPGTGTPVNGGLSYREAHFALELLHESGIITSAEFVEVSPPLDTNNKTARLAIELICSLLGQRIL